LGEQFEEIKSLQFPTSPVNDRFATFWELLRGAKLVDEQKLEEFASV